MKNITEMLKGVLEGCILQIISREATYGYAITKQLNELGFNDVVDGTVYTILLRLEKSGKISSVKKKSELGPPRKFFSLTPEGEKTLVEFWDKWEFITQKLNILKEDL